MKKNNTYILIFLIFIGVLSIVSYWDSIQESFDKIGTIQDTPVDLVAIKKMIEEERNKPCEHKKFTTLLDYIEGFKNENKITIDIANDLSNNLYTMYAEKIKQEAHQSLSSNLYDQNRIVNCLNEIGSSSYAHNDNEFVFYSNQFNAISNYITRINSYTNDIINNKKMEYKLFDFDIASLSTDKYEEAKLYIYNLSNINADFHNNTLITNAQQDCINRIENEKNRIEDPENR
jgi:hypothetical protein